VGKLPTVKKILREDIKDAPKWANTVIDTLNTFMDNAYSLFNKNITFSENIGCFIKEISYRTPASYPTMDNLEFMNTLKTKATGILLLQCVDKATYSPPLGPVYVPWVENNGTLVIYPITGLEADKTYIIRLLVS
jgi:hypothetical protein